MKKVLINLALILIGFVIYFLQANFFSWFSIGGIRPNLFVIYILFIGLFGNRSMGLVYGAVWGIFLDLIFMKLKKERFMIFLKVHFNGEEEINSLKLYVRTFE